VIRALVRQHFRCQYCGMPFDLLKPITAHRPEQSEPPSVFTPLARLPHGVPPPASRSPLSPPSA
jgi:hypothetical protein